MGRAKIVRSSQAIASVEASTGTVEIAMPLIMWSHSRIKTGPTQRRGRVVAPSVSPDL
eukprot:COSAG06_NODE_57117_length_281_cov_1.142857_1_plen_57_part_01